MKDEYIRKQDAVDVAKHAWAKGIEPSQYIESIEPANVAKIVRCENCQYRSYDEVFCCYWCEHDGMVREVKPDFYCGYGEE